MCSMLCGLTWRIRHWDMTQVQGMWRKQAPGYSHDSHSRFFARGSQSGNSASPSEESIIGVGIHVGDQIHCTLSLCDTDSCASIIIRAYQQQLPPSG
jgi:hypothetical protein